VRGRETGKGPSTIVRFHQEHLADEAERHSQRLHWKTVLDTLDPLLGEEPDEG
jgi:hypothetical protein